MTFEEEVPAPAATRARTYTQTREQRRTREGVRVPSGGASADATTPATSPTSSVRTFCASRLAAIAAGLLYLIAAGFCVVAIIELPESPRRATIAIVVGAVSWAAGEIVQRRWKR